MGTYINSKGLAKAFMLKNKDKLRIGTVINEIEIAEKGFNKMVDVVEVIHARWEINSDGYYPYCSNCKTEPENGVMTKHCPECGAIMDGRNDS